MACTDSTCENRLLQKASARHPRDLLLPRLMSGEIAV